MKNGTPMATRKGVIRRFKNFLKANLRRGFLLVLVLGLLIGAGTMWFFRGRTISDLHRQLGDKTRELDETLSGAEGECYDSYSGIGGECPEIAVVKTERKNDPQLHEGEYFVVVEVEMENKTEDSIMLDMTQAKLKDKNNYIYQPTMSTAWDAKTQTDITYETLTGIHTFSDMYNVSLSEGEKVRGNLVFKVTGGEQPFHVSYFKSRTAEFNL